MPEGDTGHANPIINELKIAELNVLDAACSDDARPAHARLLRAHGGEVQHLKEEATARPQTGAELVDCAPRRLRGPRSREGVAQAVQSVKAVAEFLSPVAVEVTEVNARLAYEPNLINEDPYGDGWLVKILGSVDDGGLLDATGYEALLEEESH